MEDKSTSNTLVVIQKDPKEQNFNGGKKKKRFSLFRTAMVLLRNRPNEKPKAVNIFNIPKCNDKSKSDEKWKRVVGSLRPLHMQDNLSTPPQSPVPDKAFCVASMSSTSERSEDELFASSPALSTTSWGTMSYASTTSLQDLPGSGTIRQSESTHSLRKMSDNMSRYASALNLHDIGMDQEIEEDVEEDDDDNVLENCDADNMIDAKADEFIARFYQQMRTQ